MKSILKASLLGCSVYSSSNYLKKTRKENKNDNVDLEQIRNDLQNVLFRDEFDYGCSGPGLIRLAWHASGTYDKASGTGGCNGASMRFSPEDSDPANAGLVQLRRLLEPVK